MTREDETETLSRTNPTTVLRKGLLSQSIGGGDSPEVRMYVESLVQAVTLAHQGDKDEGRRIRDIARLMEEEDLTEEEAANKTKKHGRSINAIDAVHFIESPSAHAPMCEAIGITPSYYRKGAKAALVALAASG